MMHGCRGIYTACLRLQAQVSSRCVSTLSKSEARKKRSELFDLEKKRQKEAVGRVEKIEVKYCGPEGDVTLMMNKDISTPFHCAKHISEAVMNISALALVDGEPWDMHKPLPSECQLKFLTLKAPQTNAVNRAFWRTCSLMLGAVADNAFKDDVEVHLYSFPAPNIKSGSFMYDVHIGLSDWQPSEAEMRCFSALFVKLAKSGAPVERLTVDPDLALTMFEENPYKVKQIPDIAKHNNNNIVLYRIGEHVDISKGAMVGNTNFVGRCTIAAVHRLPSEDVENLFRFQGVALPSGILLNHFAYSILEERAKKLNNAVWMPNRIVEDMEDNVAVAVKV